MNLRHTLVSGFETLARLSDESAARLEAFVRKYGDQPSEEPAALRKALFPGPRPGAFGVLRNLQALQVLAAGVRAANTAVSQAAQGLRDADLMAACGYAEEQNRRQQAWLHTHLLHRSAHTLTVPS